MWCTIHRRIRYRSSYLPSAIRSYSYWDLRVISPSSSPPFGIDHCNNRFQIYFWRIWPRVTWSHVCFSYRYCRSFTCSSIGISVHLHVGYFRRLSTFVHASRHIVCVRLQLSDTFDWCADQVRTRFYYKIRVWIYFNVPLTTVTNSTGEPLNFNAEWGEIIYFCLDHPLTRINAICIACALWIIAFVMTIPNIYHTELVEYPPLCGSFCVDRWQMTTTRHAYALFRLAVDYLISIAVMAYCYRSVSNLFTHSSGIWHI